MSQFTIAYCDTNCGCDRVWFDFVAQMAHWLGGALFTSGIPLLCGKWITWWAALAYFVWSIIKEWAIDVATEADSIQGSAGKDFGFAVVGIFVGVLAISLSQLPGSMWPWTPRCKPCCPPTRQEEDEDGLCCDFYHDPHRTEENDPLIRAQGHKVLHRQDVAKQRKALHLEHS